MAAAHLDKNGVLVDHLTIHETDWAYCPSNVRTDGHDWKATGGVSMGDLEILVRGMRERAKAVGGRLQVLIGQPSGLVVRAELPLVAEGGLR